MRSKMVLLTGLALVALAGLTPNVQAAAPAPMGVWYGQFADGSGSFALVIRGNASGGFTIANRQGRLLRGFTGVWSWSANATGGVLTLHYLNAGFHNKIYFGISWLNDGTIVLTDYYTAIGAVRVILRRG